MVDPANPAPDASSSSNQVRATRPPAARPVKPARARDLKGIPSLRPPRWGFFKGLLTGAVMEVPAIAAGVWALAQWGVGDATVPFMRILRLTAIFAGIAGVFTAAGIGRL